MSSIQSQRLADIDRPQLPCHAWGPRKCEMWDSSGTIHINRPSTLNNCLIVKIIASNLTVNVRSCRRRKSAKTISIYRREQTVAQIVRKCCHSVTLRYTSSIITAFTEMNARRVAPVPRSALRLQTTSTNPTAPELDRPSRTQIRRTGQ